MTQFHNHVQWLKVKISGGPLDNQLGIPNGCMATTKASKVWFSYSHNCTLASGTVWSSSGPPGVSTFSYCAFYVHHCCLNFGLPRFSGTIPKLVNAITRLQQFMRICAECIPITSAIKVLYTHLKLCVMQLGFSLLIPLSLFTSIDCWYCAKHSRWSLRMFFFFWPSFVRITFTCILCPQCVHIYIIYISLSYTHLTLFT